MKKSSQLKKYQSDGTIESLPTTVTKLKNMSPMFNSGDNLSQ